MSGSISLSLTDFTAYELPTKKCMRLFSPKTRLRVRVRNRAFVSPTVKVGNQRPDETKSATCTHWPWDDKFSRPSLADDDVFEVEVERRFLLGYACIRRTKPMTIEQIRTGDSCALPLYDGERIAGGLDTAIEIGEITFALRYAAGED